MFPNVSTLCLFFIRIEFQMDDKIIYQVSNRKFEENLTDIVKENDDTVNAITLILTLKTCSKVQRVEKEKPLHLPSPSS